LRCLHGDLLVGGSSAFATATARAAGSYESYCRGASVRVVMTNSQQGTEQLRDSMTGGETAQRVALSEGKANESIVRDTAVKLVAIVPYTVVLNRAVYPTATGPVDLTTDQVRKVFDGRHKTWREIDSRFADIEIKIVARGQSGSRIAFERYVLGDGMQARPQGPRTSSNCLTKDYASPDTFLCEESTTSLALDRVAGLDGAVGYADTPDAQRASRVILANIDGRDSGLQNILAGYPFWTVEYAYVDGRKPAEQSIAAAFVDYLTSTDRAKDIAAAGYPPCGTNAALCERR
jgi:phosphate transport system substrate-binding protein